MPTPERRSRDITFRRDYWNANFYGPPTGFFPIVGRQITVSEGHPWSNEGFKGVDIGGNFYTKRNRFQDDRGEVENPQPQVSLRASGGLHYFGPIYALPYLPNHNGKPGIGPDAIVWPADISSSDLELDAYGATAIANCKPTTSPANLSTALAEVVREGLPSIIGSETLQSRARSVRASGSEYLNVQFGWLPLVNDVQDLAKAISSYDKLSRQYERDAGRVVRRSYEFPLEKSTSEEFLQKNNTVWLAYRVLGNEFKSRDTSASGMPLYKTTENTKRRWFSGAFSYYLPTGYASWTTASRSAYLASQILGVELTPEVLWNLAPWSWAADWFGNVGDVLANISDYATNGLVVRYGYIMEHSISKVTYTVPSVPLKTGTRTVSNSFITEVKKRRQATPFGFGVDFSGLTAKQISILAALGLTKLPR